MIPVETPPALSEHEVFGRLARLRVIGKIELGLLDKSFQIGAEPKVFMNALVGCWTELILKIDGNCIVARSGLAVHLRCHAEFHFLTRSENRVMCNLEVQLSRGPLKPQPFASWR